VYARRRDLGKRQIGERVFLAEKTVKNDVSNVLANSA
jgi:DNA-binding NarL/FixJ family response regulator